MKKKNSPEKKPAKSDVKPFRSEKGEKIDLKSLAWDERTWKIVGAVFLLIAFIERKLCYFLNDHPAFRLLFS